MSAFLQGCTLPTHGGLLGTRQRARLSQRPATCKPREKPLQTPLAGLGKASAPTTLERAVEALCEDGAGEGT